MWKGDTFSRSSKAKKAAETTALKRPTDSVKRGTPSKAEQLAKAEGGAAKVKKKPKAEKKVVDNRDYGYTQEQEFKQTRHKSPAATISKLSPHRKWERSVEHVTATVGASQGACGPTIDDLIMSTAKTGQGAGLMI